MRHRVLFVDDEAALLRGLERAFHHAEFEVVTASSGPAALDLLARQSIDAVVSDHDMPGMNGIELLTRICEQYPRTVRFILTGNATLEMAIAAVNEGRIQRFFTKPCNTVDLAVTIRQALMHRDLMAEARRLLFETRRQRAVLDVLEREHPGITAVQRDASGAIVLDEIPSDPGDLLEAIEEQCRP